MTIVAIIVASILIGLAFTYVFEQPCHSKAIYEASLVEIEALLNGNVIDQSKRELLENQKKRITERLARE